MKILVNCTCMCLLLISCKYTVPTKKLELIDEAKITAEPKKTQVGKSEIGPEEICTTYEMEWAAGNKESLLLDPSKDVIYPGAIIQSESIQTGQFKPVLGDRYPIIISTTLTNLKKSSDTINVPDNSTVTQSINKILNSKESGGVQPAEYALTVTDVRSQEDFNFKVNAKFAYPAGSFKSGFDFSNGDKKSRFFVDFTQIFYTINVDLIAPDRFFKSEPKTEIGFAPAYVSSVKYGRRIILIIESDSNYNNKKAQLEVELKGLTNSANLDANSTVAKLVQEKSIKALVVGGAPQNGFKIIEDPTNLAKILEENSVWDPKTNPGLPMAYTLRHTSDNAIFRIAESGKYKVRECVVNPTQTIIFSPDPATITNLAASLKGGDAEFKGHGPKVDLSIALDIVDNEVFADIHCSWLEWDAGGNTPHDDFTLGLVDVRKSLGKIKGNYKILDINGKKSFQDQYVDSNEQPDGRTYTSDQGFIKSWTIIGDTQGDDVIGKTGIVSIDFYPIIINVKKLD